MDFEPPWRRPNMKVVLYFQKDFPEILKSLLIILLKMFARLLFEGSSQAPQNLLKILLKIFTQSSGVQPERKSSITNHQSLILPPFPLPPSSSGIPRRRRRWRRARPSAGASAGCRPVGSGSAARSAASARRIAHVGSGDPSGRLAF